MAFLSQVHYQWRKCNLVSMQFQSRIILGRQGVSDKVDKVVHETWKATAPLSERRVQDH